MQQWQHFCLVRGYRAGNYPLMCLYNIS